MLTPISPIEPVAPWLGGKHRLAATLAERIARIPHRTYAEPFVGMGGVFFRRAAKPPAEVVNDIDGEIINLFRILQRHYPQFIDVLRFQVASRAEFQRLRAVPAETLTDLERAARFLYLQRLAFGGQKRGGVGGASGAAPSSIHLAGAGVRSLRRRGSSGNSRAARGPG